MKKFTFILPVTALITTAAFSQPVNNDCSGALDINSAFGQAVGATQTLGPYDNTTATSTANDPTTGFECFGEPNGSGSAPSLENTLWFTFTGDGGKYFIETADGPGVTNYIDFGDTQIAIYTGSCGSLVPFACNEDGPSATSSTWPAGLVINTTVGQVYYMMIDGYNDGGSISAGEYLIEVTQQATIGCSDPSVTLGTASANKTYVCPGDTVRFDITGVVTPTIGAVSGLGWVISGADISGNNDPLNDPSVVAGYAVQSPAPANSFRLLINDGQLIGGTLPYGSYYWTPIIFGNGVVANPPGTFITDLTLDPTCTTTGTSILVDVLAPGDPLCNVGIADINDNGFGIASVYPIPVTNELNIKVRSNENSDFLVSVKDNIGREVISDKVQMTPGERNVSYDATSLSSGVYFITVTSGQSVSVAKFVKQ
ncbi:MAG TPA: T9SS type A sorting domain-containing protein [Bacteroidia bacterium]|nr:T9SS type A sorting domain-containing protein [Bacteroidia bacterium]